MTYPSPLHALPHAHLAMFLVNLVNYVPDLTALHTFNDMKDMKERRREMHYRVKNLKGYAIGATDGDIGKLADFYFDDEFWTIRYLVAETGNWLLNRKVLISPFALGKADLSKERVNVALTKKQVEESPSMDTDMPVSGQHEALYLDYYGYPYYWEGPLLWGPTAYPQFSDADRKRDEEARANARRSIRFAFAKRQ